ncbi:MAG: NAD(P)-dependent oxidoreductase, partial [Actinobacteria bacterium]
MRGARARPAHAACVERSSSFESASPLGRRAGGLADGSRAVSRQVHPGVREASWMKICVTGASGKIGRAAVDELRGHGHDVAPVDLHTVREFTGPAVIGADLTDSTQAAEVLRGVDAVVHIANHPAPDLVPPTRTFHDNVAMNFNVLHAAVHEGVQRVVWASSETTLGLPFSEEPPAYVPVDEDHYPRSRTTYALSKVVTEAMAVELSRWSGIPMVALRFSNVYEPHEYQQLPDVWKDVRARDFNLWGYIDVRDAALACRLALDA